MKADFDTIGVECWFNFGMAKIIREEMKPHKL